MKKLIFFTLCLMVQSIINGQTWKADIQRTIRKPHVRTLKLRPNTDLTIGSLLRENDSLKECNYYYGVFLGGSSDSLRLRISSIEKKYEETKGLKQSTKTPAKYFILDKADSVYTLGLALTDVHFIRYQQDYQKLFGACEDWVLFSSLAVLIVSPFICYNYKEGSFNAEAYKYWALGSTAGIVVGFSFQFLGANRKLQFKPGWPSEKAKVWTFSH